MPGSAAGYRGLRVLIAGIGEDLRRREVGGDGGHDLRNEAAAAYQKAEGNVLRLEVPPFQSIGEWGEEGAGHPVLGLAGVEEIRVQERVQHTLKLCGRKGGGLKRKLPIAEPARMCAGRLRRYGVLWGIFVNAQLLAPGDFAAEADLQGLRHGHELGLECGLLVLEE